MVVLVVEINDIVIGVEVFAVVAVLLLALKFFHDALFGEEGGLFAPFFLSFFAQLLDLVESEVELINSEHQEKEHENEDSARFAYILVE